MRLNLIKKTPDHLVLDLYRKKYIFIFKINTSVNLIEVLLKYYILCSIHSDHFNSSRLYKLGAKFHIPLLKVIFKKRCYGGKDDFEKFINIFTFITLDICKCLEIIFIWSEDLCLELLNCVDRQRLHLK